MDLREHWIQAVYFRKQAWRVAAAIAATSFFFGMATGWLLR